MAENSSDGDGQYRILLLKIAENILKGDLDSLKHLCKKFDIGDGVLESISKPLQLFEELERRELLGPNNKDILANLLGNIGRKDLKSKLLGIRDVPVPSRRKVPGAPVVTGIVTEETLEEISEDIGPDWKRLGRKLLANKESVIEDIDRDLSFRRVKEKAYQVMLKWKRLNGDNANAQVLSDALTSCHRKDVAEKLADIQRSNQTNNPLETLSSDLAASLPFQEGNGTPIRTPVQEEATPSADDKP